MAARSRRSRGSTPDGKLIVLQQAFVDNHGLQCGFCTPGMLITLTELLRDNPDAERAGGARGAHRQSVPLHRLCRHRRGGARCGAAHARRAAGADAMGAKHFGARVDAARRPGAADRPRPLRRRREACRHAARLLRAQPARPRPHPLGIDAKRGAGDARRPRRASPPTICPTRCAASAMPMLLPNPAITAPRTQHRAGARRGLLCRPAGRGGDRRQPLHRRGRRRRGRRRLRARCRRSATAATRSRPARRARTPISPPTSPPSFRMAYGDVDAAFADAAACVRGGALAASRRRHGARRPRACSRATIRRPTCSRCGRRRRRRISAAACSPTCSSAISNRSA